MEEKITTVITFTIAVLNVIVTFIRTGSLKKGVNQIMNYRAPDYQKDDSQKQSFTNLKTEYVLNERTNELEEKEEKTDLQSMINSSIDTALDRVLQRLMPDASPLGDTIETEYNQTMDDLDDLAQMFDVAEEYREKFGLPLETSVSDIYKRIQEESTSLKSRLDNLRKPQEDPAKEKVENETQKDDTPRE